VDYPNGSIAVSDEGMTKRTGDFNFSLIPNNTGAIGRYRVNGFCDFGDDVRKTWVYYFAQVCFNSILLICLKTPNIGAEAETIPIRKMNTNAR